MQYAEQARLSAYRATYDSITEMYKKSKDRFTFVQHAPHDVLVSHVVRILNLSTSDEIEKIARYLLRFNWVCHITEVQHMIAKQNDPVWAPFYGELIRRVKPAYSVRNANAWFYYDLKPFRRDEKGFPIWELSVDVDVYAQVAPLMGVLYLVRAEFDVTILKRVRSFLDLLKRPMLVHNENEEVPMV